MAIFSKPLLSRQQTRVPILVALVVVILARSRLAAITELAKAPLLSEKASPEALKQAQQQVYFDEEDGSKTLLIPFRGRVSKVRTAKSSGLLKHN